MNPKSAPSSYRQYIPLLTPALLKNSCNVNDELLIKRVIVVALPIIFGCAIASTFVGSYAALGLLVIPIVKYLDRRSTERVADQIAVNEYLDLKNEPSRDAIFRIQHHLSAVQLLIAKKGDLNRKLALDHSLIRYVFSIKIFELLIRHGADIKGIFGDLVVKKDSRYLEFVLKSGKIKFTDFTPDQQVAFWLGVDQSAGKLLKQYGFDVNIRNSKGFSPLLRLASNMVSRSTNKVQPNETKNSVITLLKCGADPTVFKEVGNGEKFSVTDAPWTTEVKTIIDDAILEWQKNHPKVN